MEHSILSSKFADKFEEIVHHLDTRLSFYSLNKLGGVIKDSQNYQIKMWCINYAEKNWSDASYVGQTSRQFKTRISKHRNHINRNTTTQSVITEHRLQFNHDFDWEDVKILGSERFLGNRLVSEIMFIKKQKNLEILKNVGKTDGFRISLRGCWRCLYFRSNAHFVFLYFLRFLYTD